MTKEVKNRQYNIGEVTNASLYCRYLLDKSENVDIEEVIKIINEENLEKKDPELMMLIARTYRDGKGIDKNLEKAEQIMAELQKNGIHTYDMEYVDLIYKRNKKSDFDKATNILNRMIQGDPEAYGKLGRAYRDGKGVEKDLSKAIELLEHAANNKVGWARNELFDILYSSDDENDHKKAVEIISITADKNDRYALPRLGKAYRDGKGVEKDLDKALDCFERSYEAGVQNSGLEMINTLIERSYKGDLEKAFRIALELSDKGNKEAMAIIGNMYRDGLYVERDAKKALEWFDKASGGF